MSAEIMESCSNPEVTSMIQLGHMVESFPFPTTRVARWTAAISVCASAQAAPESANLPEISRHRQKRRNLSEIGQYRT